jgi:hypothetical protein
MKISKEDLIKDMELSYSILRDEISTLENRMNTLVGICGVLIVFVSGLIAYINTIQSSTSTLVSKYLFGVFLILCLIVIILVIMMLYPRSASFESIKNNSSGIEWKGTPEIVGKFGDFANYWLTLGNADTAEEFIKETYIKTLWGKELLKNKKIKFSKYIMITFTIAMICLVIGSLSMLLSF